MINQAANVPGANHAVQTSFFTVTVTVDPLRVPLKSTPWGAPKLLVFRDELRLVFFLRAKRSQNMSCRTCCRCTAHALQISSIESVPRFHLGQCKSAHKPASKHRWCQRVPPARPGKFGKKVSNPHENHERARTF